MGYPGPDPLAFQVLMSAGRPYIFFALAMYFDDIESEAIRFLREATPNGEELFIGFSGGKDSIAATYIVRLSGLPHMLYYTLGGIDPPKVLKFIKTYYAGTKFLRGIHRTLNFLKR